MRKNLIFLVTLFFTWLSVASYFHFNLQYKQLRLKQSQNNLAWQIQENPIPNYEFGFIKIGDMTHPFLLNKNTGITYKYFISEKEHGWEKIPFPPIDTKLKYYQELENQHGALLLYLLNSNLFESVEEYNKFLDDFNKYYKKSKKEAKGNLSQ